MTSKLYVGNLSYDTSEDTLRNVFSQAGEVKSALIITNKMSGRSKGFGFVEMGTEEEAQKAIEMLNGQEIDGRNIIVDIARPPKPRRRFLR
ncbi:MAG: RNA-binding protein [Candidatus Pacebacteria bacterium]|nr:RNA-binding protein [Candidatus Paceibacterota bacterium]